MLRPVENPGQVGCGNVARREFSARTKRAAWERANGMCEGWWGFRCNAPLDLGNFHYDHIDPDYFSKDNELENCQVLCHACHKAKTAKDVKAIAKSKRIQDKRKKVRTKRGFKGWRRFDGTPVHAKDR